jgi:hypothetical protein
VAPTVPVIYADFEGRKIASPGLPGTLACTDGRDEFTQWVLAPALRSATVAASHLDARAIEEAAATLAKRLERTGAVMVAWSTHEDRVFQSLHGLGADARRIACPGADAIAPLPPR